jgi:hypothetical protein
LVPILAPTPWESVLSNNIVGTYNAYEAAREAGVRRFVYASSNHASGLAVVEGGIVGPDAPIRPDSLYGVSKCFGESVGRYYHDLYGMQVICLRIGSCHGKDDHADQRARMQAAVDRGGGHPITSDRSSIWLATRTCPHSCIAAWRPTVPSAFSTVSRQHPAVFDLQRPEATSAMPKDNEPFDGLSVFGLKKERENPGSESSSPARPRLHPLDGVGQEDIRITGLKVTLSSAQARGSGGWR